ncbi:MULTISPECIES: amidase [Micromonospora]|uniref:amidase n=1 Tax=Micromonospora TaxID=1873 RepID=UPI0021C5BF2E|nr:amidase [Micromonospora sp. Mcm103]
MEDLATVSATALLRALDAGAVSSADLVRAHLDRIERLNPAVNAVVAVDRDRALAAAAAADRARAAGEPRGPLHGLPMTVKDVFETAGLVTTAGAPELAGHRPDRDAEAVARLRAAGAVVVGKTNVPPYAGDFQTDNPVYGLTRNPWDPGRTAGGSSGGSAAALAAGLTPLELGSDIAGSIRLPSHFCGVYGHLPTFSAVPTRGHIPGPPGTLGASPLGAVGPMARHPADLDLALGVLVGDDAGGVPGGTLPPAPPATRRISGCRIAVWLDNPLMRTDRETLRVLREFVARLAGAGALVEDRLRPPRPFYESYEIYLELLLGVLSTDFSDADFAKLARIARRARPDDDRPVVRLARGLAQPYRAWHRSAERQARSAAAWQAVFERVDLVITPSAPLPAYPHQTDAPPLARQLTVDGRPAPYAGQLVWASLASLARLPATAVPVGRTAAGLPVGVQVIGPRWGDRGTLAFAAAVHELTGGYTAPPGY